uniref:Uncharacterized protein n=1 Tax=Cucumis melo TaxID=3656 RepID=A0A9I9EGA2_CUCME
MKQQGVEEFDIKRMEEHTVELKKYLITLEDGDIALFDMGAKYQYCTNIRSIYCSDEATKKVIDVWLVTRLVNFDFLDTSLNDGFKVVKNNNS